MATVIQTSQTTPKYSERWVYQSLLDGDKDYDDIIDWFENDPSLTTPKYDHLRRMMKRLVDLGFVKRNDNPNDGRSYTYQAII